MARPHYLPIPYDEGVGGRFKEFAEKMPLGERKAFIKVGMSNEELIICACCGSKLVIDLAQVQHRIRKRMKFHEREKESDVYSRWVGRYLGFGIKCGFWSHSQDGLICVDCWDKILGADDEDRELDMESD